MPDHSDLGFIEAPAANAHADLGFVETPSQPAKQPETFLQGLWRNINPVPLLKTIVDSGLSSEQQHPIAHALLGPAATMYDVGKAVLPGLISAHKEQVQKAEDAYGQGRYSEAAGHMLAAAVPLVGPAAAHAGEVIGGSETEPPNLAGGLGEAAGLIGGIAAPEVAGKVLGKAADAGKQLANKLNVPDGLRENAQAQYAKVLAPAATGDKLRTQNVVPELIDRGTTALSRKGLAQKASDQVAAATQKLEDTYNSLPPDAAIPLKPVLDHLEAAKQKFSQTLPNGQTQPLSSVYATAIRHVDDLGDILAKFATQAPSGELVLPVSTARVLRQAYDEVAAKAGRYNGVDLSTQSQAAAHGFAADALREGIAQTFPDVEKANQEFKLWRDTQQVLDNTNLRKMNQAPSLSSQLLGGAGAVAGFTGGGLHGAILGKATMEALQGATGSPAWQTVSSVWKNKLADAIENQHAGPAQFYAAKLIQAVNTADASAANTPAQ